MMASAHPEILVRPPRSTGLVWTVAISAAMHALAIALLLAAPRGFLGATPPMESYTVDLVAPDVLGGTNLIRGPGGEPKSRRAEVPAVLPEPSAEELVAAVRPVPAAEPEKPAPAAREQKAAKPPSRVRPPAAAKAAKPPSRVRPPVAAKEAKPPRAAKSEPAAKKAIVPPEKVPAAAGEPARAEAEIAKSKAKKSEATADAKKPEKVAARAVGPEPVARAATENSAPSKPRPAAPKPAPKVEEPKAKAAPPAERPSHPIDERIEKAIEQRAALVQAEKKNEGGSKGSTKDLDQKIAAAVRRRLREAGTAAVAGESIERSGAGGAVGSGPGKGIGGIITDYEYVAYRTQMEARVKEAWVWPGTAPATSAVVEFNITPAGDIVNVRTKQSSGDASYDASAERAVRRASPLGPPPQKYRDAFWSVELEFRPEDSRS
jgi:colicin import membrane protein